MKKLPIGIQTLAKIREEDAVYVGKTGAAVKLINDFNYVFLSRPRRFGKSLFVDTLKELCEGNRELFSGLAAENLHDWSVKYPVIRIAFGGGNFSNREQLDETVSCNLTGVEKALGVTTEAKGAAARLDELIAGAAQKYDSRVVVLIDEYDKPLLDNITNHEFAEEVRTFLAGFYSYFASDGIGERLRSR